MLPWYLRLYFWGVHGIFVEVVFCGVWEFVVSGKWQLMGCSSMWSFLTYGIGTFFGMEYIYNYLRERKVPLLLRCLLYVICAYAWEFGFGVLLDCFGARPWDYEDFDYDFMGLITLEYAPAWYFGGLYFEFIMSMMRTVELIPEWKQKNS